jgi:hypothetical protein
MQEGFLRGGFGAEVSERLCEGETSEVVDGAIDEQCRARIITRRLACGSSCRLVVPVGNV